MADVRSRPMVILRDAWGYADASVEQVKLKSGNSKRWALFPGALDLPSVILQTNMCASYQCCCASRTIGRPAPRYFGLVWQEPNWGYCEKYVVAGHAKPRHIPPRGRV